MRTPLMQDSLQKEIESIKRLKKAGNYSARFSRSSGEKPKSHENTHKTSHDNCIKCTYSHDRNDRCPADGRTCHTCDKEGHFTQSILCKAKKKSKNTRKVRYVYETETSDSEDEGGVRRISPANVVNNPGRTWPGVERGCTETSNLNFLQKKKSSSGRYVNVNMGNVDVTLFCDTGSRYTILPPEQYRDSMGDIVPAKCHLRAWGSEKYLDTKGMFQTTIECERGAKVQTWVYVVGGTRPEPLLGDNDAENLGIITFDPRGKESNEIVNRITLNKSIPDKLRQAGMKVKTEKPEFEKPTDKERQETMDIVKEFTGSVFTDKIGLVKVRPVKLEYEKGFDPAQPPRYPIPYHYRDRVSSHLDKLRSEGVIEDVNPSEPIDIILNTTISEKKTAREIRMNIDARPLNLGAKHTKYHITTPQEIRHELNGASVFSEIDMGNGYHQIPLDKESQEVFQTHQGLHRMKRLFFGPKNSSGIFHHEVQKSFAGIPGCLSIHDNILVYGKGPDPIADHNANLRATLQRAKDRGFTFKLSKSTFLTREVPWFGRIYSGAGISADPEKINNIVNAGRPNTVEDVKSLLQAAAYNAKFAFDHKEGESYEDVTAPLRELLQSGAKFEWTEAREGGYQKLIRMMNDRSILAPFIKGRKTHVVSDASPHGISASIYQEEDDGTWIPVDHTSRALSKHEQAWQSQIDWESLAKMWGMQMFRPYLVGTKFTSWGDHQPLLPFYNDLTKPAPARIAKHRSRIIDLEFTDKYLPGKKIPSDYNSRHPASIEHLSPGERAAMYVDDGDDIQIMRMIFDDLPPALSEQKLVEVAQKDNTYQKLKTAVLSGRKSDDPSLVPYMSIFNELSVINNLVCRGERIVIPQGQLPDDEGNLREWVVDLGHSGHMGAAATKRLLRLRLWFPGMDKMIDRRVEICLPCQAAVHMPTRDPLKPSTPPKEPWEKIFVDHWGPTPDRKHLLVLIDALTRYPEVTTVQGTSAEANIQAFVEVFARHGYPERMRSDNGAPFNGTDTHILQAWLKSVDVEHIPNLSAEDPEASGHVEIFMKHLKKVWHTALIEQKDPYIELQRHLMQVRATPHTSTGKSPAELLFGRKFRTKIPDVRVNPAAQREDIVEARQSDIQAKARMKEYKDNKRNVKPHSIQEGDTVLLRRKSTKANSPYDPKPFDVTKVRGTQITAERGREVKTRDAQRWKKVRIVAIKRPYPVNGNVQRSSYLTDPDIGVPDEPPEDILTPPNTPIPSPSGSPRRPAAPAPVIRPQEQPHRAQNFSRVMSRHPDIIWAATPANRPTRDRRPPKPVYEPYPTQPKRSKKKK